MTQPTMNPAATPADAKPTKLVRIELSAKVLLTYTEVIEVPTDITDEELNEIAEDRYRVVDGGSYQMDSSHWERSTVKGGDCENGDAMPDLVAFRTNFGMHIELPDEPDTHANTEHQSA